MSLIFTGANGVFTRWGAIGGILKDINQFQNNTLNPDLLSLLTQFPAGYQPGAALSQQINPSPPGGGTFISNLNANLDILTATAQAMIVQMVQADSQPSFNGDLTAAVLECIRQMRVGGVTIKKCQVAGTVNNASGVTNQGNGTVCLSTKRADGLDQENLFAESTLLKCTGDAQSGNTATPGNEPFQWTGSLAAPSLFDPLFPQGSGQSQSLQTISALYDNSNGNGMTNGTFESWTGNTPANWTVPVGANQVVHGTAQYFTGTSALQIIGDSKTNVTVQQQFNASGTGTAFNPFIQSQYATAFWVFLDRIPPPSPAPILQVALVDGAGNITKDSYGNQNVCTFNLFTLAAGEPALSSSHSSSSSSSSPPYPAIDWTPCCCNFRTPDVLPAQLWYQFQLATPLTGGVNLYIDQVALGQMTLLYTGGPSAAIFDGSTHFIAGGPYTIFNGPPDQFLLKFTNDRGGAADGVSTFQTLLYRMLTLGADILFPSSASPVVSDGLIAA